MVIDWPEYHAEGMGCGLEDRGITDRYEAMRYGWDEAIERVAERLPDKLYLHPSSDAQDAALWRDLVSHQKFNNVPAVGYAINQTKKRLDVAMKGEN